MPVLKIKNNGAWEQVGGIPDHTHVTDDITDFPTSLPANGGNADTVDGKHASDFASAAEMTTVQNDINDINTVLDGIEIPTTLPNPNPLTFTGAVEGSYDGSNPLSVNIPRGDSIVPAPSSADNGTYLGCENGAATWMPVEASGGGDISLGLTAASVGQTIKVKAVDENGKPTEWEASKEKTLKWITVHKSTLTEEATSFSVSADENGKLITDYNPLGIAVALYIPADSTQADNNGQLWVYPQSKMGDNAIRIIGTISGWKTASRDAGWMWQGGDILVLTGNNYSFAPVYRFSNYVMNGVYLLVRGNGNHLPVGTKAVVTILCEV